MQLGAVHTRTYKTETEKLTITVVVTTLEAEFPVSDARLPDLKIYHVTVTHQLKPEGKDDGVWHEGFCDEGDVAKFLRGLQAGYGMNSVHLNLINDEEWKPT